MASRTMALSDRCPPVGYAVMIQNQPGKQKKETGISLRASVYNLNTTIKLCLPYPRQGRSITLDPTGFAGCDEAGGTVCDLRSVGDRGLSSSSPPASFLVSMEAVVAARGGLVHRRSLATSPFLSGLPATKALSIPRVDCDVRLSSESGRLLLLL